jgi:hypothetical protein
MARVGGELVFSIQTEEKDFVGAKKKVKNRA